MKPTPEQYRQAYIKSARFETPEFIPMTFSINDACWQHYPHEALFELMEEHTFLFPDFQRPVGAYVPDFALVARAGAPFQDDFACVWETAQDGITGTVLRHPLADWDDFDAYRFPDPNVCMGIGAVDWEVEKQKAQTIKDSGGMVECGLRHGHTFLQLCDIRGYEALIFDMMDEEPRLKSLIAGIEAFNLALVHKHLATGADMMRYPEDLGMQNGPMLSPECFDTYILPSYRRIMAPSREKGVLIHMHSDGDIHTLVEGIVEGGVDILNLQDIVNGIDWIAKRFRGKTCVELDVDRQRVTPFGTPAEIDDLIRQEVETIGEKSGGLMMIYGLYPGVPLENARALMDAMERYAFYFR